MNYCDSLLNTGRRVAVSDLLFVLFCYIYTKSFAVKEISRDCRLHPTDAVVPCFLFSYVFFRFSDIT